MLTRNLIQSELSLAYLHAIAAKSGIALDIPRIDYDSVDATLTAKTPHGIYKSVKLDVQLKSTQNWEINTETKSFPFDFSLKNYNDLRSLRTVPLIAVVLCLPENETDWVNCSEEQLALKKCAYWVNLKGYGETVNTSNIRIHVPLNQQLTPEKLLHFMNRISNQQEL
jgi:Domain of unknown function (DUF4365)